jgi:hypothetical protein
MTETWDLVGSNSCEDWEWADLLWEIQAHIDAVAARYKLPYHWVAVVQGFGWRSLDGETPMFSAREAAEIMHKLLPNTECSFKIRFTRTGFLMDNSHHDKPCGGELYELRAVPRKEYEKSFN